MHLHVWVTVCVCVCVSTSVVWRISRSQRLACPVCRYPRSVCSMGGWINLQDRPQQRNLSAVTAPQQPPGHRHRQVWTKSVQIHTQKNGSAQSHRHKHKCSSHWVMVYIPKQKQTLPICQRLKYYASTAMAEQPLTAHTGSGNTIIVYKADRMAIKR